MERLKSIASELSNQDLAPIAAARKDKTLSAAGWHINLARQYLNNDAEAALLGLAHQRDLKGAIGRLFAGEHVNSSEDRPAMHWALRLPDGSGSGLAAEISASLKPVFAFADAVRSGKKLPGVKTILHVGIGGSDLGPRLLHDAFAPTHGGEIDVRFVSNIDPLDLDRALNGIDPATTLVTGISKSFSTEETKYNLDRARDWLKAGLGDQWPHHLAIVTANPDKANAWLGIESDQLFGMADSIGGRFSLWSAGSLSCVIAFGSDWFRALLAGAHAMDEHFRTAPASENIPLQLALTDYWNMSVRGVDAEMVLAYSNALRLLPAYLQQLLLESNGKLVTPEGKPVSGRTIIGHWGGEGTIGQHSYHQWLHQGSSNVAAEFIITMKDGADEAGSKGLVAHALAQAEVLANGYQYDDVLATEPGLDPIIACQKVIPGGKPSMIFACKDFGPEAVGALIAMYEHRVYMGGVLWGINSFDQWGVERGKVQAGRIKAALLEGGDNPDPVTDSLVNFFR